MYSFFDGSVVVIVLIRHHGAATNKFTIFMWFINAGDFYHPIVYSNIINIIKIIIIIIIYIDISDNIIISVFLSDRNKWSWTLNLIFS